ncbi:MAG: transcriptional regulator [Euryarchaeota archaeon]|nr:transcriptional regulator [Euryarchaeota archaeon]
MELEPRQRIYRAVKDAPGIHFRELQRALDMPTGQLEHHLIALCEQGALQTREDRYYKRYYAAEIDTRDKDMLSALRQENPRRIAMHLLMHPRSGHGEMAGAFGLAPSTLSFYLRDMVGKGILAREKAGRESLYSVVEPERVSRLLITYRRGFLDRLVDNFIGVWFAKEYSNKK